jgi:hypothetical protein
VLNVGKCPYTRKVVGVEEVNMVWQPTNSKYHNKNQKHFDNLQKKDKKSNNCMISGNYVSKGQLISKCPFGVFRSPKKTIKFM